MKTILPPVLPLLFAGFLAGLAAASPARAFDQMLALNHGWPATLAPLQKDLDAAKNYLVIVSRNPDGNIDFRDADRFKAGLLATPIERLEDIGHNVFGWSCRIGGKQVTGMSGQTGEEDHQTQRMLLDGWGLTPLFSTFRDGFLMLPEQIDSATLRPHLNESRFRLAAVLREVSAEECESVVNFMRDYTSPQKSLGGFPPSRFFGINIDPDQLQGGGCGTLAVAALAKASFFGPVGSLFWRDVSFKWGVFGKPGVAPPPNVILPTRFGALKEGFRTQVADHALPFQYLEMQKTWKPDAARAGESASLHVVDPEMMFLFYRGLLRDTLAGSPDQGRWDEFTRRAIQSRSYFEANPAEALKGKDGLQTTPVDERFDAQAAEIVERTHAWYQGLVSEGYHLRRVDWGTQVAIEITR